MHDHVKAYQAALGSICPILAELESPVLGTVLAELFAMYLASNMSANREKEREEVTELWLTTVRTLVPIHEKIFLDRLKRRSN